MLVSTMTLPAVNSLVRQSFVTGIHQGQEDVKKLFIAEKGNPKDNKKRVTEVDKQRFAGQKLEGQKSVRRGIGQGYSKDFVRKTISITRPITGEGIMALTAHELAKEAISVGEDVRDRIYLDMANVLTFANAQSYTDMDGFDVDTTVGDGLSLLNNGHTLKNSSDTYSNIVTGAPALSENSLVLAEDFFNYNCVDNYGQRLDYEADTIITTRSAVMQNRVRRIFGSMSGETNEGTANANSGVVNPYRNKYQHITVVFDVDANNKSDSAKKHWWFLASLKGDARRRWQAYYVRWISPTIAPVEKDEDAFVNTFTARSAYALGAVSGRGIVGSLATS